MQLPILRTLAFVAVGNAALSGRDVSAFATSDLFKLTQSVGSVIPRGGDQYEHVAGDPLAWFDWLKANGCRGLRLHTAPMEQKPGRLGHIAERMLVGFVGGGPRWLIEAIGANASSLWEGYDRAGDRDAQGRIWLTAYARIPGTTPQDDADANLKAAAAQLAAALDDILILARKFGSAPFDGLFEQAKAILADAEAPPRRSDFEHLADLDERARRLLAAVQTAWVFGGMGSWNDTGPDEALAPEYERTSETLFRALEAAMPAIANSTYRG